MDFALDKLGYTKIAVVHDKGDYGKVLVVGGSRGMAGAAVLAQDEPSSVVWGMPGAVAEAGLADMILPLKDIGPEIARRLKAVLDQKLWIDFTTLSDQNQGFANDGLPAWQDQLGEIETPEETVPLLLQRVPREGDAVRSVAFSPVGEATALKDVGLHDEVVVVGDPRAQDTAAMLAELDRERYEIARKQAQSAADAARTDLEEVVPQMLEEAKAALALADKELERYTNLVRAESAPQQQLDVAETAQKAAAAKVAQVEALRATKASLLETSLASVEQAEVKLFAGSRAPEPQNVDRAGLEPRDQLRAGFAEHRFCGYPVDA